MGVTCKEYIFSLIKKKKRPRHFVQSFGQDFCLKVYRMKLVKTI